MADRDRAVAVQEQHRHRLADDIAAADNDAAFAFDHNTGRADQLDDAGRRAGQERVVADHDPPHVVRVEGVDILARVDMLNHELFVQMLRQRGLHENAVDFFIRIQLFDQCEQLFLRRFRGQNVLFGIDTRFRARLFLVVHIDLRGRIVSDEYDGHAGLHAARLERGCILRDLHPHLCRDGLAVNPNRHCSPPRRPRRLYVPQPVRNLPPPPARFPLLRPPISPF